MVSLLSAEEFEACLGLLGKSFLKTVIDGKAGPFRTSGGQAAAVNFQLSVVFSASSDYKHSAATRLKTTFIHRYHDEFQKSARLSLGYSVGSDR